MVPKNLMTELKVNRRDVWLYILYSLEREPEFFSHVITGDFGIRPLNKTPKSAVAHCKLSPFEENENEQIQNQIVAHLNFWQSGDLPQGFVPPGQRVNQTFYREVLERLGKRLECVWPGIARTWMLHHDKTPCHTAVSINYFLAEKKNSCGSSATLFAGSNSLWLLFIPPPVKTTWNTSILLLWVKSRGA